MKLYQNTIVGAFQVGENLMGNPSVKTPPVDSSMGMPSVTKLQPVADLFA